MVVVAARIIVRGRVQGVGYRWFARDAAAALSGPAHPLTAPPLAGWVRNRRDGTVELEVSGHEPLLQAFLERLRTGPPAAAVSAVDVQWLPPPEPSAQAGPSPSAAASPSAGPSPSAGLQIRPTA